MTPSPYPGRPVDGSASGNNAKKSSSVGRVVGGKIT